VVILSTRYYPHSQRQENLNYSFGKNLDMSTAAVSAPSSSVGLRRLVMLPVSLSIYLIYLSDLSICLTTNICRRLVIAPFAKNVSLVI
jgi:hypothetical protein